MRQESELLILPCCFVAQDASSLCGAPKRSNRILDSALLFMIYDSKLQIDPVYKILCIVFLTSPFACVNFCIILSCGLITTL